MQPVPGFAGPQMLELAAADTAASAVARAAGALLVDYARAPAATDEQAGGEDEAAATGARDLVADVVERRAVPTQRNYEPRAPRVRSAGVAS